MSRLATATVVTAVSVLAVGAPAAVAAPPPEKTVLEIAHRGSSFEMPENTLAAFQEAIDDKADLVEIDVQRSADGVLVVMHDTDLRAEGLVERSLERPAQVVRRQCQDGFAIQRGHPGAVVEHLGDNLARRAVALQLQHVDDPVDVHGQQVDGRAMRGPHLATDDQELLAEE